MPSLIFFENSKKKKFLKMSSAAEPASVAQLDGSPTGDQAVALAELTRAGSTTFFHDHEIFSTVILSLPLI